MSATLERLRTILARDYKLAPDAVTPDATLEALGIDSLGVAELLWTVEDELKIKLAAPPDSLQTVGDVVAWLDETVRAQSAAAPGAPAATDAPEAPEVPTAPPLTQA